MDSKELTPMEQLEAFSNELLSNSGYNDNIKPMPVSPALYKVLESLVLLNRKASIFDKFSYKELSCDICEKKRKDELQEMFKKFL